jgi:SAM-dependent methyltransferase
MEPEVRALAAFYDTPLGLVARRAIMHRMKAFWPDIRGLRLLGYGFPMPYLRGFSGPPERIAAVMPAGMGVMAWPAGKCAVTICEEDAWPFADVFFDRILIVHGLEGAESLRSLLRQVWRVLAPEGRVLIVAPNRASLWSQLEYSPFGHGRPFSRGELHRMLCEALFEPGRWERALYAPPLRSRTLVRSGLGWERAGSRLFPGLGGVHVVEAAKSLYPATPVPAQNARAARLMKTVGSDV